MKTKAKPVKSVPKPPQKVIIVTPPSRFEGKGTKARLNTAAEKMMFGSISSN